MFEVEDLMGNGWCIYNSGTSANCEKALSSLRRWRMWYLTQQMIPRMSFAMSTSASWQDGISGLGGVVTSGSEGLAAGESTGTGGLISSPVRARFDGGSAGSFGLGAMPAGEWALRTRTKNGRCEPQRLGQGRMTNESLHGHNELHDECELLRRGPTCDEKE